MGRPKMLLPWDETSVLGHLIEQWTSLHVEQIAVVCATGDQAINAELDRLGFRPSERIINPSPELGMFSSVRCAARWPGWKPTVSHWAIVLGDQPHLRLETLRALVKFAAEHPQTICQPARQGRPRHPVLMPKENFQQLADAAAENLKQFLQARAMDRLICESDDPGLDFDLDYPADYEQAVRLFAGREAK